MQVTKQLYPQTQTILEHLKNYGHITPVEAGAVYKVRSLSKRISEIKAAGHKVKTQLKADACGQRYAYYSL